MGCGHSTADKKITPAVKDQDLGRPSTAHTQMMTLDSERYTRPEIVFDLASTGDVALLSYLWMEELARSGMPLARRQDLPPEAFVDVTKLRAWHAAAPAHVAAAVVPVLSISYCWLEAKCPDGTAEQLRHIIKTLQPHAEEWREFFPDMGVFMDWGSLFQKDPALFDASETPEAKPEAERAAFEDDLKAKRKFYGGEAYEKSRSPEVRCLHTCALCFECTLPIVCTHLTKRCALRVCVRVLLQEKAAFGRGLEETMDVWYAHQMIATIFVTWLPEWYTSKADARIYDCLLYTSPSPRDRQKSRMPSSA